MRQLRCVWGQIVGATVLSVMVPCALTADESASEVDVRAALIYNVARFVDWPPAPEGSDDSLQLCAYGGDDLYHAFAELEGRQVRNRSLRVRWVDPRQSSAAACNILYVARDMEARTASLTALRHEPVLTVGESPQFAMDVGVMAMVREANRVRFIINRPAAESSGLRMSSQLLAVSDVLGDLRTKRVSIP